MEALLRWRDADGALQFPAKVSEAFNDYDLANGIGEMMQTKVFADMARWRTSDLPLAPVSINVTPVEFLRGDFARRLLARMRHFDIPPPGSRSRSPNKCFPHDMQSSSQETCVC